MKYLNLLIFFIVILFYSTGCKKDYDLTLKPKIILKNGDYTKNEQIVPIGGKLKFGITSTDGGAIITNLRIQRIADGKIVTELDKGIFIKMAD